MGMNFEEQCGSDIADTFNRPATIAKPQAECPKCSNTGVDCQSYGEYACGACDCMHGRSEFSFRAKLEARTRERLHRLRGVSRTAEVYGAVQTLEWILRDVLEVSVI